MIRSKKMMNGLISVFVLAAALFASTGVMAADTKPTNANADYKADAAHARNLVKQATKKKIARKAKKNKAKAAIKANASGSGTSTPATSK